MSPPLVSVIVPVFDVEAFLPECLDTLRGQTLQNIEILCVHDASTDGSLGILRQYAALDPRIRVIEKPTNEGLAVARNDGISAAAGTWLAFVDSDDIVDRELAERALSCARSKGADLVIYDYACFRATDELQQARSAPSLLLGVDPSDVVSLLSLGAYAWTKFVRADHFRALGVRFPPGLTYEDVPVHWDLLTRTERIALLPERLYFYRQRPTSIGYRTDWTRADHVLVYDLVLASLLRHPSFPVYREAFVRQRLKSFHLVHDTIARAHRPAVRAMIRERMDADHWRTAFFDPLLDGGTRDFLLALRGETAARLRRAALWAGRWLYRSTVRRRFGMTA